MLLTVQYIGNKHLPKPRAYWMFNPCDWVWVHNPKIPSWYLWIVPDHTANGEHGVWFAPPIISD